LSEKKINCEIALRYVSAFFDLAKEDNQIDTVEKDMIAISEIMAESEDFNEVVTNNLFKREDKAAAVLAISKKAKFSDITKNFLGVLAMKNRLDILPDVVEVFRRKILEFREEVEVEVTVANGISEEQENALKKTLAKSLKCKSVKLEIKQDKTIIGGLIIKVGSTLIDNSVKSKIDRLDIRLKTSSCDTNVREVA